MLTSLHINTPLGLLLAVADEDYLYYLNYCRGAIYRAQLDRMNAVSGVLQLIQEELAAYFAGKLKTFTTPLFFQGTDFQNATWSALMTIPYGQTWSYAELAKSIGKPTAFRAVANANGANPLAIIAPCHRVIYSDGSLGGYAGGLDRKRYLLEIESSTHSN